MQCGIKLQIALLVGGKFFTAENSFQLFDVRQIAENLGGIGQLHVYLAYIMDEGLCPGEERSQFLFACVLKLPVGFEQDMEQVDVVAERVIRQFVDELVDGEDGRGEAGLRNACGQFLLQHPAGPLVRKDYQCVFQGDIIALQNRLGQLLEKGHISFFAFAKIRIN